MSLSVFAAAREAPERAALVLGGRTLTFGALAARVRARLAAEPALTEAAAAGAPVALVADIDGASFVLLHAAIAAGAAVHLLHPRLAEAERAALLSRIRPALVLAAAEGDADLDVPAGDETKRAGDASLAAGVEDARHGRDGIRARAAPATDVPADARPLAVVYTSGSTGAPKGVELSRAAFAAAADASAARLGWRDDDRWLVRIPLAHVGGLSILTRCLLARRCVVLADRTEAGADGTETLMRQIERDRVTLVSLVPTQLARLLERDWRPPPFLRVVLVGGAAAPPALLERAADQDWPVLTTYGLTEACSQVATQRPGTVNRGGLGVGPPLDGVEVRILDEMIQVRGPALFTRYHPIGAVPDPRVEGGWLPTGDRGRLDAAGNLHVLGRADDVIVSGGENVDPLEVEAALLATDTIAQACVFAVPDAEWGQRVCAALVAAPGAEPDPRAIDRLLRGRLAGFKRPRAYALLDALPGRPSGKVDRRAVAAAASGRLVMIDGEGG